MKLRSKKESGKMFREIRVSKGLSLEQLAEKTNGEWTVSDVEMFELGNWSVSAVGFMFMCKALEIEDPDAILYEEL